MVLPSDVLDLRQAAPGMGNARYGVFVTNISTFTESKRNFPNNMVDVPAYRRGPQLAFGN